MPAQPLQIPGDEAGVPSALLYPSNASEPRGLLVLAHGAGAGQAHPFMVAFATGLAARGLDVVTFNFPYMQQQRRAPDRPPVLEEAFRRAIAGAVAHPEVQGRRLFIGGKSMGGRMAVRLAASPEAWPSTLPALDGVIVFGYPLNPPGRQAPDRASHFEHLAVPTLIVQGTRDSFGRPEDIQKAAPRIAVHGVDRGDHSFNIPKSAGDQTVVHGQIMDTVTAWVSRISGAA